MTIKASQFDHSHWDTLIPPVAALLGNEAFFITRIGDLWRKSGKDQGFSERLVLDQSESGIADRVLNELETLSLFADLSLVELRLNKTTLDQSLRAVLEQWIQNSPNDKRLLISGPKLGKSESSAAWYKLLETSNTLIEANPIPSHQFAKWLNSELAMHKIELDSPAKIAVQEHTQGNLLAAGQVIERLKLIESDLINSSSLPLEKVLEVVTQSAKYTVYDLIDLALKEDLAGLNRTTDLLKAEGVESMTALWAISRELDILLQIRYRIDQGQSTNQALNSLRVWRSRESLVRSAVSRLSLTQLRKLLALCHDIDRNIKGATREPAWAMIKDLLLGLAGHPMTR
ncbi:MAG TPA: DNA polymerase III subunit delta [Gammaproteobacteria bacterium]|nr:DNA polymerase III subunit delta [Gammaproteobacteria bacterium]HBX25964.1 DNA polymerase III subunit delta [Gammaproteobacteria bacterium]